jgi:hypothetical protein
MIAVGMKESDQLLPISLAPQSLGFEIGMYQAGYK